MQGDGELVPIGVFGNPRAPVRLNKEFFFYDEVVTTAYVSYHNNHNY